MYSPIPPPPFSLLTKLYPPQKLVYIYVSGCQISYPINSQTKCLNLKFLSRVFWMSQFFCTLAKFDLTRACLKVLAFQIAVMLAGRGGGALDCKLHWYLKFYNHVKAPLVLYWIVIYKRVILLIIIGYVHQFIIHCLFLLDPW